uniref:Putative secreted protein n=1 Tax=Anopheles triannulatus TaxID=58253 RepID=A0A2M4B8B8_9DIPT
MLLVLLVVVVLVRGQHRGRSQHIQLNGLHRRGQRGRIVVLLQAYTMVRLEVRRFHAIPTLHGAPRTHDAATARGRTGRLG